MTTQSQQRTIQEIQQQAQQQVVTADQSTHPMSDFIEEKDGALSLITPTQPPASGEGMQAKMAMLAAKQYPRNRERCWQEIRDGCKRAWIAKKFSYHYSIGYGDDAQVVTGPNIRLMELIAQELGNMDYGWHIIAQGMDAATGEHYSDVYAYAWDMERNIRQSLTIRVPHVREYFDKRQKAKMRKPITEPNNVYTLVASFAARRVRACLERVIPRHIVEDAMAVCTETAIAIENDANLGPLSDRARSMMDHFAQYGVTLPMMETYLGHALAYTSAPELVNLRGIAASIKSGDITAEEVFNFSLPTVPERKPAETEPDSVQAAESDEQGNDNAQGEQTPESESAAPAPPTKTEALTEQLKQQAPLAPTPAATAEDSGAGSTPPTDLPPDLVDVWQTVIDAAAAVWLGRVGKLQAAAEAFGKLEAVQQERLQHKYQTLCQRINRSTKKTTA